jgi:2-methylisocitrate lyase-like PEP mutase family enzyme
MNMEDAAHDGETPLADLALQLEKIHAVCEVASRTGVPLVLNARTDVYLLGVGPEEKRYDETVRRLSAYRDAGADCVFAPGLHDRDTIARLVRDLRCPINILAGPGVPSIPELKAIGVARVSLGSSPMRASITQLHKLAEELKATGTYQSLEGAIPHAELNRLLG